MAITRYRGLRGLEPFASMFDWPDLYSDTLLDFPRLFGRNRGVELPMVWHPSVDMYESDGSVLVRMDLPGLSKDDIDISFDGHVLSVTGQREEEEEKTDEGSCYWSRERFTGDFHRYVHIPTEVLSEKLKAKFKDGVLEIELPKAEKAKRKKIAIEFGEE